MFLLICQFQRALVARRCPAAVGDGIAPAATIAQHGPQRWEQITTRRCNGLSALAPCGTVQGRHVGALCHVDLAHLPVHVLNRAPGYLHLFYGSHMYLRKGARMEST